MNSDQDHLVRLAAAEFIKGLELLYEPTLPRVSLELGFTFRGERVPLMNPQGIFAPKVCRYPLSITTVPPKKDKERPYDDRVRDDGFLDYRYRRSGPDHRDNVGLRRALQDKIPIFYFHGIVPGQYLSAWPAYVIEDRRDLGTFIIQIDDKSAVGSQWTAAVAESNSEARRSYVTRVVVQRVHQTEFRERVLQAYRQSCAVCRLRHRQLLDAAHIIPDSDPRGLPLTSNGLALCKLHHAAFDRLFIAVRRDLVVEVRKDILEEDDGPMLIHGLKACHGRPLLVTPRSPDQRPNPEFLQARYEEFLARS